MLKKYCSIMKNYSNPELYIIFLHYFLSSFFYVKYYSSLMSAVVCLFELLAPVRCTVHRKHDHNNEKLSLQVLSRTLIALTRQACMSICLCAYCAAIACRKRPLLFLQRLARAAAHRSYICMDISASVALVMCIAGIL